MRQEVHDCQRFREDWASGAMELSAAGCQECECFVDEATAALCLATSRQLEPSPEYWDGFDEHLRAKLTSLPAPARPQSGWRWAALAAAAALVTVLTHGALRIAQPLVSGSGETAGGRVEFVDDHIRGLSPAVMDFLAQSELFLRSFTKIQPTDADDIDDAKAHARRDLAEITQQRAAASDFAPVRIALDDYESVLREIKNLDSVEDLRDIQTRVLRNGLIASMKAYQPRAVLVSQR